MPSPKPPLLPRDTPGGVDIAALEETITASERLIYRQLVASLLSRGYVASLELAETAYTMLQIRRIRGTIEDDRTALKRFQDARDRLALARTAPEPDPVAIATAKTAYDTAAKLDQRETSKQTWATLSALQDELRTKLADLDKKRDTLRASDPEREFRVAEQWVREHLGELQHRCPNPACGQMLTVPALPHWAYAPVSTDQGPQWLVWSAELWELVLSGQIDLWMMAYVLRTSPTAIKLTAERRGTPWPDHIHLVDEELQLAIPLRARDREALVVPDLE
jgi:hypothetical protein